MSPGSGERWETSTTSARLADGDGHVPLRQHSSSRSGQRPDAFLCQRHVLGKHWGECTFNVHRLKPLCGNICRSVKEVSSIPGRGALEAQTSLCSSHLSPELSESTFIVAPHPCSPRAFLLCSHPNPVGTAPGPAWQGPIVPPHELRRLCASRHRGGSCTADGKYTEVGPGHPSGQREDRSPAELHPGLAPHPHVLLLVQSFY